MSLCLYVCLASTALYSKNKVIVTPNQATVEIGESISFSAQLEEKNGTVIDAPFTWSLNGKDIGTITQNGIFTANESGSVNVVATTSGLSGRAKVTVLSDTTESRNSDKKLKVLVLPQDTTLYNGQLLQYSAIFLDADSNQVDTTFTWSFSKEEVGTIDTISGLFSAIEKGNGFVYAHVGSLSGRGHVVVQDTSKKNGKIDGTVLRIFPEDTLVFIGDAVHYQAGLVDTLTGAITDTTADYWYRVGNDVGAIDWDGYFIAEGRGNGVIKAKLGTYTATTHVRVLSIEDTAQTDSVKLRFKNRDGNQIGKIHRNEENDVFKISGLPFPLSVLNGGKIIFTGGSLDESVSIDIGLSTASFLRDDSTVSYIDQILNGISFNVYVDSVLVSPFYFNQPVSLVLPFKEELLDTLGLAPEDLWIFFYEDTSDFNDEGGFDTDGITNVVVDSDAGVIYADVIHFSDLVIADKTKQPTGVSHSNVQPTAHRLHVNYPNPFNPQTQIQFNVGGSNMLHVRMNVYNLIGQKVRTLIDGLYPIGSHRVGWDGNDQNGIRVGSGIYICRFEVGGFVQSNRMVLLR